MPRHALIEPQGTRSLAVARHVNGFEDDNTARENGHGPIGDDMDEQCCCVQRMY